MRRGPIVSGAYSERRLKPVRNRHAESLRADYTPEQLPDRRMVILADLLARIEVAARWLDRRGGVVRDDGETYPVVRDLDRWSARAWTMLAEIEAERAARAPSGPWQLVEAHVERQKAAGRWPESLGFE